MSDEAVVVDQPETISEDALIQALEETESSDTEAQQEEVAQPEPKKETKVDAQPKESAEQKAERLYKEEDFNRLRSIKDRELADLQKKLRKFEKILEPVSDLIETDEDGNPVRIKAKEDVESFEFPTEEEWEDNPKVAREKERKALIAQTQEQFKRQKENEDKNKRFEDEKYLFKQKFEEAEALNKKAYPQYLDQESDFYKKGVELSQKFQSLRNVPEANYIINQLVELSLLKEKAKSKLSNNKNKMVIMQTGKSSATKDPAFSDDKVDKILRSGDDAGFAQMLDSMMQ